MVWYWDEWRYAVYDIYMWYWEWWYDILFRVVCGDIGIVWYWDMLCEESVGLMIYKMSDGKWYMYMIYMVYVIWD